MDLKLYYVDLHVHIGMNYRGEQVKISSSKDLTFANIAKEAADRKGIQVVGVIDCHAPSVQYEIQQYLESEIMFEHPEGGIGYKDITILLGTELEVKNPDRSPLHVLAFFPYLKNIRSFTEWLRHHQKNVELSSQRVHTTIERLQEEVIQHQGIFIPAHIFTPYKGMYGSATSSIKDILDISKVCGVELGLGADTSMAARISELDNINFLTNSDAHSLKNIGREYNVLLLKKPTFKEVQWAFTNTNGRKIIGNYGLNPALGKYYRTFCKICDKIYDDAESIIKTCRQCGNAAIIRGTYDRVSMLADRNEPKLAGRPDYHYQIPLSFIPRVGPKTVEKLLIRFGTEMSVLHKATQKQLEDTVGVDAARWIVKARTGQLLLSAGGGGKFGGITLI